MLLPNHHSCKGLLPIRHCTRVSYPIIELHPENKGMQPMLHGCHSSSLGGSRKPHPLGRKATRLTRLSPWQEGYSHHDTTLSVLPLASSLKCTAEFSRSYPKCMITIDWTQSSYEDRAVLYEARDYEEIYKSVNSATLLTNLFWCILENVVISHT